MEGEKHTRFNRRHKNKTKKQTKYLTQLDPILHLSVKIQGSMIQTTIPMEISTLLRHMETNEAVYCLSIKLL